MSKQFAEFDGADGVDHRREVLRLFKEVDRQAGPYAGRWRAAFLQSLVNTYSTSCFRMLPCEPSPCSAIEAYFLFIKVVGDLGVPIQVAAKELEDRVRHLKDFVARNKVMA